MLNDRILRVCSIANLSLGCWLSPRLHTEFEKWMRETLKSSTANLTSTFRLIHGCNTIMSHIPAVSAVYRHGNTSTCAINGTGRREVSSRNTCMSTAMKLAVAVLSCFMCVRVFAISERTKAAHFFNCTWWPQRPSTLIHHIRQLNLTAIPIFECVSTSLTFFMQSDCGIQTKFFNILSSILPYVNR